MKILGLYDGSGPKYHRILMPLLLMPGIEFIFKHLITEDDVQDIDILFFNRHIPHIQIQKVLDWRIKYGFKIVVDYDDHWQLGPDHYLYNHYKEFRASEVMEVWIKEADCVTVTHERLHAAAVVINSNCHILPNAIPVFGQFTAKKQADDFIRMFWAGGVTHKNDISLLKGPVKRIHTPACKWVIAGYVAKNPEWTAMASAFTNGGKFNHDVIESLPVESYYYSYSKCDVAIVPLLQTTFNTYKSNLKILEAANIGSPAVVSKVHPYLGFPDDIVNYVEKQAGWYDQCRKLLNDKELRIGQGLALQKYCNENFNFEKINLKRREIFNDITYNRVAI